MKRLLLATAALLVPLVLATVQAASLPALYIWNAAPGHQYQQRPPSFGASTDGNGTVTHIHWRYWELALAELLAARAEVAAYSKTEPLPTDDTPDPDLGLPAAHARMEAAEEKVARLKRELGE